MLVSICVCCEWAHNSSCVHTAVRFYMRQSSRTFERGLLHLVSHYFLGGRGAQPRTHRQTNVYGYITASS